MPALLLLHEPPDVASLSIVAAPTHKEAVPAIDDMAPLTVTVADLAQPVASV
jgi:hypothetical protein